MNNLNEKAREMLEKWESYETEHIKGELLRNLTPLEEWDEFTPMWGIMWRLDKKTERWALDNIDKVSKIGLRMYVLTNGRILLGVDGAGYDFFEAHWVPLYKEINGIK